MKFFGLQKMTLLDFPGKVACTLFTGGCNFRCPFCHNASLVTHLDGDSVYEEEEILDFLRKRTGLLDGVCVTGGEPLMHPELLPFLRKVREMGLSVKLDTNGSYPDLLRQVLEEGLADYVAVDIKNSPEKYGQTVGIPDFDLSPLQESISMLINGKTPFEFRTTVTEEFHTVEDIKKIAQWIAGAPRYFLQGFVDSGDLIGEGLHAVSAETMGEMRDCCVSLIPSVALRGVE